MENKQPLGSENTAKELGDVSSMTKEQEESFVSNFFTSNTPGKKEIDEEFDLSSRLENVTLRDGSSSATTTTSGSGAEDSFTTLESPYNTRSSATKKSFTTEQTTATCTTTANTFSSDIKIERNLTFASSTAPEKNKTLIVYPPQCLDHHTGGHQESRNRLLEICGPNGILSQNRFLPQSANIEYAPVKDLHPVQDADILRVHDAAYISHIKSKCESLPTSKDSTCFESTGKLDFDSEISHESFNAAKMAAGAVCYSIDRVMNSVDSVKNAFVAVRPPGHHAGPSGCVPAPNFDAHPEMCSCGFCLLNNVAIGAAYAMTRYGPPYAKETLLTNVIEKVAIIDFDIHHGNGTEAIIRNLLPHTESLPLPSSWAPVTFDAYKPWKGSDDAKNVFFSSVHLYGGVDTDDGFYPGSGKGPGSDYAAELSSSTVKNVSLALLGPSTPGYREKLSMKQRKAFMATASKEFRKAITVQMLPALREFNPDLILISAGFDGHADDFYYYLSEDDYEWLTAELRDVAESCASGRIVSVLEGGYNVTKSGNNRRQSASNLVLAAELHKRPVRKTDASYGSLPRSVAAHVDALLGRKF